MSEEDKSTNPTDEKIIETEKSQDQIKVAHDTVLSQVVKKISNEPFLFVIAIVILLIGLVVQATELASPVLRLALIVFAFLAFVAMLGYYILEGWKLYSKTQQQESELPKVPEPPQSAHPVQKITGKVKAKEISGDAQLGGVRATDEVLKSTGQYFGEVEVDKAKGGKAYGVEIGRGDDKDNPTPDNSS